MKTGKKKLSIAHCKEILNKDGYNYTDEQMESIRDFPYVMAGIQLEHFESMESQEDNLPSDSFPDVKAGRSEKNGLSTEFAKIKDKSKK